VTLGLGSTSRKGVPEECTEEKAVLREDKGKGDDAKNPRSREERGKKLERRNWGEGSRKVMRSLSIKENSREKMEKLKSEALDL